MVGAGSRRFTEPTQLAKMRTNTKFPKEISLEFSVCTLVRHQCVSNRLPIGAAPLRKPKVQDFEYHDLRHSAGAQALRAHRKAVQHIAWTQRDQERPCAVPGRTMRTGARLWWPRRSHNRDTNGEQGRKKGNYQPAPVRRICSQSTRSTRLNRAPP
jgi:hypothetical protein